MKDYDKLLVRAVESITSIRKASIAKSSVKEEEDKKDEEEDFDGEPGIYYIFDPTGEPIKAKDKNHWRKFINSSIARVRQNCVRGKDGYEYEIRTVFRGLSRTGMWRTTVRRKGGLTFSKYKLYKLYKLYGGNYADAVAEHEVCLSVFSSAGLITK